MRRSIQLRCSPENTIAIKLCPILENSHVNGCNGIDSGKSVLFFSGNEHVNDNAIMDSPKNSPLQLDTDALENFLKNNQQQQLTYRSNILQSNILHNYRTLTNEINKHLIDTNEKFFEYFTKLFSRQIREILHEKKSDRCRREFLKYLKNFITRPRSTNLTNNSTIKLSLSEPILFKPNIAKDFCKRKGISESISDTFTNDYVLHSNVSIQRKRSSDSKIIKRNAVAQSLEEDMSTFHTFAHASKTKNVINKASTSRKIVRFADSLGLELEKVKLITNTSFVDAFTHTYDDYHDDNEKNTSTTTATSSNDEKPFIVLIPLFGLKTIDSIIKLDDYTYDSENNLIKCLVKVKNLCYQKRVFARITFNNWISYYDLDALYVRSQSSELPSFGKNKITRSADHDFFGFCILFPEKKIENNSKSRRSFEDCVVRCEFAICYCWQTNTHWDNNFGENYKFQCFYNK